MRMVIQRVSEAKVVVENNIVGAIENGFCVLVGFGNDDNQDDLIWMAKKLIQLRVFSDENRLMNLSIQDVKGKILLISQFTLFASTKKGNRPSFIHSAKPEIAIPLYENFISILKQENIEVETGIFGADMKVSLTNDGPVTITIDSKNKE